MKSNYDAVLFDFDGTFADTGEGVFDSVQYAVKCAGFAPLDNATLRRFIGPPIFDSFKRELLLDDKNAEIAVENYRKAYADGGILLYRVYDGIIELLTDLKENGIKIGIASAKPQKFIIKIIAHLGLEDFFDYISAPADDFADQNKTTLISKSVEVLGVKASRTLMVGDRYFDINGANGAGVNSVGVTFGYGDEAELRNAGATFIAHNADEIRAVIFSKAGALAH